MKTSCRRPLQISTFCLCLGLMLSSRAIGQAPSVVFQYDFAGNMVASFTNAAPLGVSATITNVLVNLGDPLSLGIVVTNATGQVSYQWRLNGTNIAGATNSTLWRDSVAATNAGIYSLIITSGNGNLTNIVGDIGIIGTTNDLLGVAYGASRFVAVGAHGTILTSIDQRIWSLSSSPVSNALNAVIFTNGQFIAVGDNGTVTTSSSGTNWTLRSSGTIATLKGVAYGNGRYLAVGTGGTIVSSTDAISWTVAAFGGVTLNGITFGAGLYLVVGDGGVIWASNDGIQWVIETSQTLRDLRSVALASNNRFVAVGEDGTIVTSDVLAAYNWALEREVGNQTIEAIVSYGNTLIAVGAPPQNLISLDGLSWESSPSGARDCLFAAVAGPTNVVAVGRGGTVCSVPLLVVDHFVWDSVPQQQRVGRPFAVRVTAVDAAGNTATGFNGIAGFSAVGTQAPTNTTILGGATLANTLLGAVTITSGYSFSPSSDLLVTHIRSCFGSKVSIWSDTGTILASLNVPTTNGIWIETALGAPLTLRAGTTYRIGCLAPATNTYYGQGLPPVFPDGTINQSFYSVGDTPPFIAIDVLWICVDLRYTVQRTNQVLGLSPTSSGSFTNGIWAGTASVLAPGTNVSLTAVDTMGHTGLSGPFSVVASNDLSIFLSGSPNPVAVSSNITYTMTVFNAGPGSATGITVTNTLPSGVTYAGSTSPSQGTWAYTNSLGIWNVGTLGDFASATMSFTAAANAAGTVVLDKAVVARAEAESNLANNAVAISNYVPPTVQVYDWPFLEGNFPEAVATLQVVISPASPLAVSFNVRTIDFSNGNSNAAAGVDYGIVNKNLIAVPYSTTNTFTIPIFGDLLPEPNEDFGLYYSGVVNATFPIDKSAVTIVNDDANTNQLSYFSWGAIPWPQRAATPFSASITAKDFAGSTVTAFGSTGTVLSVDTTLGTNHFIADKVHSFSNNLGNFTVGYSFAPTHDICVTHVRHYSGAKVSIWTQYGALLASQNVQSMPEKWMVTQLPNPLFLRSNVSYRVSVLTDSKPYYYRYDGTFQFKDGIMGNSYFAYGDKFPDQQDPTRWYFVDLQYTYPAAVQPTSVTFTNGLWAGNVTLGNAGEDWRLFAQDGNGHFGWSPRIPVYITNDFATTITWSPATASIGTNLAYTIYILNPGTNVSTGVTVTDTIPANVTFVSATASQGSVSQSNGVVSGSLGTIPALSAATVTVTVTPTVAGSSLTNTVVVTENQTDPNLSNNVATVVLTAGLPVSMAMADGADNLGPVWRAGGSALWSIQTITHDASDALQSGIIGNNQQSWIEFDVRGPGTLSYWWKVSSEVSKDVLRFYTNSVFQGSSISGLVDWQQKNWSVPPGFFTLRWSYEKDGSGSSGSDAGWLDAVNYTIPAFYLTNLAILTNGGLQFQLKGTNGQRLFVEQSADLSLWIPFQSVTLGSSNYAILVVTNVTSQTSGLIRAYHINTP